MILSCNNVSKSFGTDEILKNCSFNLEEREKAAIIGINGAGKSTFLKIIMGLETLDNGTVTFAKDKTVGYLAQHQDLTSGNTIYDELLSVKEDIILLERSIRSIEKDITTATGDKLEKLLEQYTRLNNEFELKNGYSYKSELVGVLKGLSFGEEDFNKPVNSLSGGEKTRVSLGKLLLSKPDIILLDEPTNHLDLESIKWLEGFLLNYNGSILIVAHDRYFLDKTVSKIIELDNGICTVFSGNYTDYSKKKAVIRNMQLKEYLNQQREIRHQEEVITKLKQFNREKTIKRAESREKMLDKIELVDKPVEINDKMNISLEPNIISGNDVLSVKEISKSFDSNILFKNISFDIKRGEHIALIGNNGTGKTTILKIINNIVNADSGEIKLGSKVSIGYYDQEHNLLNPKNTIFEEISNAYPYLNNTQIRNTLAAFLFTNDDVFKLIDDLSGGEKGRVSLAKLMLSEANFLILDEPTNHLDMASKEILENALNSYTGTILYVSHDRYFINTTATRIIELTNQTIINYIGNYDYYEEKRELLTSKIAAANNTLSTAASVKTSAVDWKASKEEQAKQRKKQNELKKVETEIADIESKIAEIDELFSAPEMCTNSAKLTELHDNKTKLSTELEQLYEKWELLSY